jgi:hypothetical protein
LVKIFIHCANFGEFALRTTPRGIAQRFGLWKIQTEQNTPSKLNELGNGREDGRGATIRQAGNGRAVNTRFNPGSDFNPTDRCGHRHDDRRDFGFSMRNDDDGAIVIRGGNGTTVQPGVKRRAYFRRRHQEPDGQRHHARRQKEALPGSAADGMLFQLHCVGKVATDMPSASDISGRRTFVAQPALAFLMVLPGRGSSS